MTLEYFEEEQIAIDKSNKKTSSKSDIYWRLDNLQLETFLFLHELDTLLNEYI